MLCLSVNSPQLAVADLIELRLDQFLSWDLDLIRHLQQQCPSPMIFTAHGVEDPATLRQLARLSPVYMDIACDVDAQFLSEFRHEFPHIRLILSYHDFEGTPESFDAILQTMQQKPADLYKLAFQANSALDALRLLVWTRQSGKNLITVSMGPKGQFSRLLSKIVGSNISYCCMEDQPTASGQFPLSTMQDQYRFQSLNHHTAIYALLGKDVSRSISDRTHNAAFGEKGRDAVYVKIALDEDELGPFLTLAKQLPFSGFSVTMPYKEKVLAYLDVPDATIHACLACNTLKLSNGKWHGTNTDGIGALTAIEAVEKVKGKNLLLIGAGGAAKAIAFEAKSRGAKVWVMNRTPERAEALAPIAQPLPWGHTEGMHFIINCTPVFDPIPVDVIPFNAVVMDIKTLSHDSPWLAACQAKGCRIIHGDQMFHAQAQGQFKLWFQD